MTSENSVFLAHSSNDKEFVLKLAYDIRMRGIRVWLDEWELAVGDSLVNKISKGIESSGWLLVVLSRNSVESQWVNRELNAGLATELERQEVFVLPALLDDCELPIFLKDKVYADFRASYLQGLDSLFNRLFPQDPSSLLLDNIDEIQLHLLPSFSHGELVTDYDLNRVFQAVNTLERRLAIPPTDFQLTLKGQIVAERHINQILEPIENVRSQVGLETTWQYHPVEPRELYKVEHMNELYGIVNEVIRKLLR